MKKNILVIFTGPMDLGGIERSLIGLLQAFDYEQFNVDLFLYSHHGVLFNQIDERVNLLPEVKELAYIRESFGQKIKHGCYYSAFVRLSDMLKSFVGKPIENDKSWARIMRKFAKPLKKEYDLALSFFLPFDFLIEKVNAKVKLGWIHTDYSSLKPTKEHYEHLYRAYSQVNYAVGVSSQCVESFVKVFPEFKKKTFFVENILSESYIRSQADLVDVSSEMKTESEYKLLSIGRFCDAKNFDSIPEICKRILEQGLSVTWFLIGFGKDEELIRSKITEYGMDEHVVILGKKDNPYPYIKACDIYVQPSRYEGRCVSVTEAQILNKPVVITNYATASSQLNDGFDGVIVPLDNQSCADGIVKVLKNINLQDKLVQNTKANDYSNANEVQKLYKLIH